MVDLGARLAGRTSAVELQVAHIGFSDFLFKTLFIQFAANPVVSDLVEAIRGGLQDSGAYQFDPHLSLIYKTMSQRTQQEFANSLPLPTNTILFDQLNLVMPRDGDWGDIAGWQIQTSWPLAAS